MRGRTNNKGLGSGGKSRSKSKSRKIKCYECHEVGNFQKDFPEWKDKGKKEGNVLCCKYC
jgi:hypothetical protein